MIGIEVVIGGGPPDVSRWRSSWRDLGYDEGVSPAEAWRLLELTPPATADEVRRAFKRAALKHHPDRFRTFTQQALATRRFQRCVAARDVLLAGLDRGGPPVREARRAPAPAPSENTAERIAALLRRVKDWLLEHALGDLAGIALLLAFGTFRLGLAVGTWVLGLVGLPAGHDSPRLWGRFLYLSVMLGVAAAHLYGLHFVGARWSGRYDSAEGLLWAFGLGSPIVLFAAAEVLSFVPAAGGRRRLSGELMAVAAEPGPGSEEKTG